MNTIENLLEKNTTALGDFIHKSNTDIGTINLRLMDLEQKNAPRYGPVGPLYSDGRTGGDSLGQDVLNSEGFAQLRSGHTKSFRLKLDRPALETKAAILNSGQILAQADRVSGIVSPVQRRTRIRDLLAVQPTDANAIEFTKESVFTNSAGPQFEASPTLTEGALKPESSFSFTLSSVSVVTLAHWIPASRQVLADSKMLLDFLDTRLRYGLTLEEDDELLNGAAGNGEISGLLASGNFTAFSRGATSDTRIDVLRKASTQLELSNHSATGFVLNPSDWESICLLKDSQARYLVGDPSSGNDASLWGRPVVSTPAMNAGTFLVGDFANAAQLFERSEAVIEIGFQDKQFAQNLVTILCEERIALAVFRPLGLVSGSF